MNNRTASVPTRGGIKTSEIQYQYNSFFLKNKRFLYTEKAVVA
jgi:hypothetical protein